MITCIKENNMRYVSAKWNGFSGLSTKFVRTQ